MIPRGFSSYFDTALQSRKICSIKVIRSQYVGPRGLSKRVDRVYDPLPDGGWRWKRYGEMVKFNRRGPGKTRGCRSQCRNCGVSSDVKFFLRYIHKFRKWPFFYAPQSFFYAQFLSRRTMPRRNIPELHRHTLCKPSAGLCHLQNSSPHAAEECVDTRS